MTTDSISITYEPAPARAPLAAVPKWADRAAHAIPLVVLPSSLWRFLMLGGVAGIEHQGTYRPGPMEFVYVAFLSVFSEGLALLAFGLVRPWGERVPRWVPFLGGRRVPVKAAVIPAATGAFLLTALYAYFFLNTVFFHFHPNPAVGKADHLEFQAHGWALVLFLFCYVPILAWAPLLAAVTYAYYKRRTRVGDMLLADAQRDAGRGLPAGALITARRADHRLLEAPSSHIARRPGHSLAATMKGRGCPYE